MDKLRFSFILGMLFCYCSGVINASTFTVTNNANDGEGSFRWAMGQANAESGVSKIVFDLSKPNDTITLTELITLSSSVEVDGSLKDGTVTIQGPELETLIHCVGMPNGGVFSLQKIRFGEWKGSNGADDNICIDLDEIENDGSAEFILNDVYVSGKPQRTCFVNATDTSWSYVVDKCYFENVYTGVRYGNKITLKNSVFNECVYHTTSNDVSEYLYVDNCEFHGGTQASFNSRNGEILNSLFDGTSLYAIYIRGKHCNLHIKSCKFINNQNHSIYSFNTADDWHIEVEDCEFYDNKRWICYMIRSYTNTQIPEPSRLLFHDNYCGITKDGEIRPNGGGIWSRMDYADIHDNVFGPNDNLLMIKDDGNDTLYVRNNYFGTNKDGVKAGGQYGAIYSTHISNNIQRWLPSDRLEYKYYEDNVFYGIKDYGIKTDSLTSFVTLSRNLFIAMPDSAIIDVQKKQVPVIHSVEKDGSYLEIKGSAGAGSKVELFRSGSNPQSALKYLDVVDADEKGDFTKRILRYRFDGEHVCISATATYPDRATSALSDPYCPCLSDTIYSADTIHVGESLLGQTFTSIGRYDSIYEHLKDINGCDSVVMHTLIVRPDPKVKSYIVTNTNDEGEGSLRYALEYANLAEADTFTIVFDFAQQGNHVIKTNSTLSINRNNLIIDGSSTPDSIIIDGQNKGDIIGLYFDFKAQNVLLSALTIRNSDVGLEFSAAANNIYVEKCQIVENRTGILQVGKRVVIDSCLVSGNETGVHRSGYYGGLTLKNCIIGLSVNQDETYPNQVGIHISNSVSGDTIINNVISGNASDGILISSAGGVNIWGNIIGTNNKYQDFGNGGSGIKIRGSAGESMAKIATEVESEANIIGFNHEYGIYSEKGIYDVYVNYIGVTPDGNVIGNRMGGIRGHQIWVQGAIISGNEGDGIYMDEVYDRNYYSPKLYLYNTIIGDTSSQNIGNKGYGVYISQSGSQRTGPVIVEDCAFGNNTKGAVFGLDNKTFLMNSSNNFRFLRNIFVGAEQPFAIKYGNMNRPTIESIIDNGDEYEITGSVHFLGKENLTVNNTIDSSKVGIELFWNYGDSETAYGYLGNTNSDSTEKWKIIVKKTDYNASRACFSATAHHYMLYANGWEMVYSSGLSDPICACFPDTTLANDTIQVGASFLGVTYTTAGVHDSIFETIQHGDDCESVVMHRLVVNPDPTRNEYYVKTKRWGKGDGSKWENAMDGKDFEQTIFLVPEGTTFYVAEGIYTPKESGFVAKTRINIIGGFPDDAESGATSDPKLYETIFNGDTNGDDEVVYLKNVCGIDSAVILNTEDNISKVINLVSTDRREEIKSLFFYGITVKGGTLYGFECCTNYDVKVTFEKCTFKQCSRYALNCYPSDYVVKECTFTDNLIGVDSYNYLSYNNTIEKCTFNKNNQAITVGYKATVSNSTFTDCGTGIYLEVRRPEDLLDLKDNTFVNVGVTTHFGVSNYRSDEEETETPDPFKLTFVGNIIDTKCTLIKTAYFTDRKWPIAYHMDYNVIAQSQIVQAKTDETLIANISDNNVILEDINTLYGVLDGTLNDGAFASNVKDNGGFTPTIALTKDILPDGTSIRFPLTETIVTDDQRGVKRLAKTCMGAYEIACVNDTTPKSDTILVGGSFLNKAYTTVGVYDSIFETLTGEDGCDKVIMHKLVVKPDQKVLNYYVKTERHGKGDGSSWENAMDGTDFATYLPLVPNGATFYVAEGRYMPIYNREEGSTYVLGEIKEYTINSSLSIIGGYPATAETGATSDPKTYHTIFTGDPSGDDSYIEDEYSSNDLQDPNEDDLQVMCLFKANPSSEVHFFGCNFFSASYKSIYAQANERYGAIPIRCDKLKLEKCDFDKIGDIYDNRLGQSTLYASECIFHNRPTNTPSSIFSFDTIHVEKSLFEDMAGSTGGVFGRVTKLADIKNSTFNNIGSSATIFERAEHIRLYNNTFVGLTADGTNRDLFSSTRSEKLEIVGNIFKGCKYINLVDDASDPVDVIKDNLLENINGTEADIMVSDVKAIPLEGTYDDTDAFMPAVKNNGGFTPTIALMQDKLSDGTSIRFPLTETVVATDQRGVERLDSTCMGAYELTCDLIVTQIKDTIQMGNSYTFGGVERSSSITTPGDYHFENTLTSVMGCDSIVKLDLHVYVIDTTQTTGTICLGSDYTLDGWNIQTTGYEPGSYTFYRSLDKENTEELILNIVKTNSVSIEDLEVVSPFCPGGSYGRIEFAADWEDMTESPYITVYNGEGRTLYNEPLNNYVRFSGLPADNYQVRIAVSESNSCFKDTVFNLVMKDVDSMSAIGPDTLYTSCVEKPNASATIELFNYHPSFDLRLDGKLIKRYGRTPNCRLLDGERMGDNYKAMLQLDSMAVGKHTIRVVDYCGNGYDVFTFVVVGPDPATFEVLSLDGNLKCSGEYGSVSLRRKGSEGSMIELSSDLFKETYSFDEGVMDMKIENLPGGEYTLHITNGDKSCPDGQTETIIVKRPEPLNVDLMVNGIVCQDAVITAYATGENENYTYTWVKPDGQEVTTSTNTLANVGAGKYKCVVKDSEGCSTAEGEAFVSEIENLSELKLISVKQDETCFGTDNAEVSVIYYDNNEHQAVTCKLTNKSTGEVVESVTSMLYWGGFYLQKIQPGDYRISLRYGTEDCNLDLKEVTRDITIKAKAKPLVIGTPVVKNVTCLSQPNGQIDFDVTGWEKGYTAELASRSVQPVSVSADSIAHFTFKGVGEGEYLFRVNDDCKVKDETISIKVGAIDPYELELDPVKTSLQCARSNDGEVVLNVSGGDHGNAVLSCNSFFSQTIEQDGSIRLTNLTKGNYTVVYRSSDNTCADKETLDFTIEAPEKLEAKFSVSGLGCDDMKLTATVSGEEKPYMFHWIKNEGMSLVTHRSYFPFALNMGDSIYCMIWSENGCDTIEQMIRIPKEEEMPGLTISSKAKQERCHNGNDAEISVTTTIAQRLTYSVPVTIGLKLKGDENFKTVNVVTDKTASHVFSDLAPGTYIVKSHFGTEGCSAGFITVYDTVEVEPLHEMSTLAMEKHDRTCLNENNGYIAFTIDGWSDSHRTWMTNELSVLGQTITFPMKRIMPYKVEGQVAYFRIDNPEENKDIKLWVNDSCGKNYITQPQRVVKRVSEYHIAPSLRNNKLDCNYSEDGWVVLAVKGGYYGGNTFYREGDEANAISLSEGKAISVTGLGAGIHTFHYKSTEENCTDESTYQLLVAPRNPLSFNTSLAGEECKDRKIVAEVTGGNTPVEVAWYSEKNTLIKKDQGTPYELQGVGAGLFHYVITDAKGCEYKSDTILANLYNPENDNLEMSGVKADSTSCPLSEDGLVSVTYAGNDYLSDLFVILQGNGISDTIRTNKAEGTVDFKDLPSGEYKISLRYAAAGTCPTNSDAEQSITVFSPKELEVSLMVRNAVCDTIHGGAVSSIIQGGTPAYTVAWFQTEGESRIPVESHTSESEDVLRNLAIRNSYFCEITDKHGCVATSETVTVGIQQMPDLDAITINRILVEDESCYHGDNGSVSVAYANNTTQSPLRLILHNENGDPLPGISGNSLSGSIEKQGLAPGDYTLYLDVDFTEEGCENSLSPRLLDKIHVESVKEPLSLKDISVVKPTCLTKPNGKVSFVVNGWSNKDTASLIIEGEREIYKPSEVDGETALFNISNLKGGDLTIIVSDVCGNSVSQQPVYGGITEFGLEVGHTYTNLKCSYSTNGFAEIKVNGGVKDSLYLCMLSVKNGGFTPRDTATNPSGTVRFENLEPNNFRFHLYTSVKNCPDAADVDLVVKAPEPIVFDKAIEGVVCENTRSGEINFVPHRRGEAVKYDNKEVSNNLIDEIYFGEYDTYFPHVTSLSITGKGLSALEMDTVMIESISYGSFQNSGGFDYDEDDEVEEEASCEREVNGLCVAPKKDPLTSLWREKGGVYQYPRYWVGMQSLPGTTYYVKATDDSACVFIDSFNILPPEYKTLSIDNVSYDADKAICDAEKRRVKLKVSGGWGDYQYIFLPDHETEGSSGLADSQTYIAGDSTWYENGKGFYRSYILDPDKYTIIVMDKKGCKKEYSQKIEVRSNIMVGGRSMIDPCGSDSTNMIKVKATRSSWYADYSPYEYQLRYEDTSLGERYLAPTKTDSVILYDVPIGKIGVFAYDKNGCSGYTNIVVKSSESLFEFNVSTFDQSAAKCYNEPSGLLRFYVMGANPPYRSLTLDGETLKDYELMHVDWAKNDTLFRLPDEKGFRMFDSISIKGLLGGEHVLTIIDSLGCRKEHKFTIEQPDELTLSISASSVCPDGEEGRIVAEKTTGGTSPYEYSFEQETGFTDKQFLESKLGVERSMYVKDANGCVAKSSNTAAVDASISWGDVSSDVLVSSWQDFDDVLAFIDVTTYDNPGNKIKYDSATVKPYGIEVLNNGKAADSIQFEVVDPTIYTYGIPDSVEYILLWNNDTIWGPSWGVPTDIAAGVRSPEVYKKLKQDIDARKKKLNEGLENLIKNFKKKENPTLAETEKFLDDSTSFALRMDSIRSEERQNCTIEMIKGHFKRLMDESVIKRMTFVRLQSSIYDLESLNDGDSLLFRYNFTHTVYLSNCDMSTDYNFSSESLYGIRVSENGFNPYKVYAKRDIIEFEVSPNPASPNEECSIYLVLSRKTTPAIMVHNMVGKELQNSLNISEPEEVKEDGEIVYRYNITGLRLAFSAVITVRTDRDAASKVVIVN